MHAIDLNIKLFPEEDPQDVINASMFPVYGCHDSPWLSFYDYMQYIGVTGCEPLKPLMELAECCGWVLVFEEHAIIQDRPTELHINEGILHCEDGPAVAYSDGFAVYCLNGVGVPDWLVTTPVKEMDMHELPKIANAQVRAEFVRKVGIDRVIYKLSKKVIDKKGEYELHDIDLGDKEYRPYLKMHNPSVPEIWHVEGVHPDCKTVEAALKWRNGTEKAPTVLT